MRQGRSPLTGGFANFSSEAFFGQSLHAYGQKGPPLALGLLRHQKPGMGLLWSPFFGRNGRFWEVWRFESSTRDPNFEPLSWFGSPFLGLKKKSKCEYTKNNLNHSVVRPTMHVV